ncbi:30S ribosomal protein S12 methylthiotransferase accessory factor YcaO [Peredibacter starrii]|uniref:30S ribosomal protein S12 methylthiotransferase accessory factor YcaO n=1 Tax=Peredibacter starrii TaxID=28202 RepID=A0AAX4HKP8_9BACT|nr:30S ribosomal protein S12 methylthiotransferase accessory factor YcaO [Peredibacter starrii]WPU63814.1 30S ribosomal protein S12 methylthiotransferase accessory factor YcaO [Peredibacter starrii]
MTKTMILGKDAALEDTISRLKGLLLDWGFDVEEASWLNPVPNVWSVHIRDRYCPYLFTNGKGTSKEAALASALGEFFERLNCNYFFADYYLGEQVANSEFVHYPQEKWFPFTESMPKGLMNESLWKFYDSDNDLRPVDLVDTNSGNIERGICALPYTQVADGKTYYIPMNIVGNLYVSNGMSAGNTKTEARVQALSEIFERSIKHQILSEGISLPNIPEEVLNRYPKVVEAIRELETHGFPIICKDASMGGKYPVISVTLLNPKEGTAFASFGAHPKFEVALERTLTELLQGRRLDQLNVFSPPSFELDDVKDHLNIEAHFIDSSGLIHWNFFKETPDFPFSDWNFGGATTESEYQALIGIFHEMEKDVYIMDFEHLKVYGCRIHVPGVSEIYPAIDLTWDNNNSCNSIREKILSCHELSQDELIELHNEIENKGLEDMLLVSHAIGVIPDADTVWADLRFGEFKAMLALAAKDHELSKAGIDWSLHFAPLKQERRLLYMCLQTLLQMEMDDTLNTNEYLPTVEKIYGKEMVDRAQKLIDGFEKFDGLHESDLSLKGFDMHQKLITSYEKLQRAKRIWAENNRTK